MNASRPLTLQQEQARIDAAREAFIARGKSVKVLVSFEFKPAPARKDWIDPETVLKRRRTSPTPAERKILRKLAEVL